VQKMTVLSSADMARLHGTTSSKKFVSMSRDRFSFFVHLNIPERNNEISAIWYIYIPRFGQLSQEKSGNHDDGHLLLLLEVLRVHEVRRRRSHAGRIQLKRKRTWHWGPGTDVMITIF
jgi:hypothetical protein